MDHDISKVLRKKKLTTSLVYGTLIGFSFSLIYWGYDAVLLSNQNVAYAWLPFIIGLICSSMVFSLAAYLTYLTNKSLAGFIVWALSARLIAELTIAISIIIAPAIMKLFESGLANWVPVHAYNETLKTSTNILFMWLALFSGILGLIQIIFVENAVFSRSPFSYILTFLLPVFIMLVGSLSVDNMVKNKLHPPLVAVNELMAFVIDNKEVTIDPSLSRQMHLNSVKGLSGLIMQPYRIFLGNFDRNFDQIEVLIDFNGKWVSCLTIIASPVSCELAEGQ